MSGVESDVQKTSQSDRKVVILVDKLIAPANSAPEGANASATASATASASVHPRCTEGEHRLQTKDNDYKPVLAPHEYPADPLIFRRKRRTNPIRQVSGSDSDRKKTVKELTKNSRKKCENVRPRIITRSRTQLTAPLGTVRRTLDISDKDTNSDIDTDFSHSDRDTTVKCGQTINIEDLDRSDVIVIDGSFLNLNTDKKPGSTVSEIDTDKVPPHNATETNAELKDSFRSAYEHSEDNTMSTEPGPDPTHRTNPSPPNIAKPPVPHPIDAIVVVKTPDQQPTADKEPPLTSAMEVEDGNPSSQSSPDQFRVPKRTSKLTSIMRVASQNTTTIKNAFTPLTNLTTTEQENVEKVCSPNKQASPKNKIQARKTNNPPPIVLDGKPTTHKAFIREIQPYIKKPFTVRYTANNTILYTTDKTDYENFKTALVDVLEHEFHTFTPREDKRHAFVLLGLQGDPDLKDIRSELEDEYNLTVYNIFTMRTKPTTSPLYLVVVPNTVTLKILNAEVKVLSHTRVRWERRRNERLLTQCRRCQIWGHATSNCFRTPRCVKCAKEHFTRDCKMDEAKAPTCANCRGEHTASSLTCPIYLRKIENMQLNQQTKLTVQQKYVEAPMPRTNPWKQLPAVSGQTTTTVPTAAPTRTAPNQNRANPPNEPVSDVRTSQAQFSQLVGELKQLNSIINLSETIQALRVLNSMLKDVKDPMQAIEILQEFSVNVLPKYNILSQLRSD